MREGGKGRRGKGGEVAGVWAAARGSERWAWGRGGANSGTGGSGSWRGGVVVRGAGCASLKGM